MQRFDLQTRVVNLNARYVAALDENKLEDWPDFFVVNGCYRVITAENLERGLPLALIYATSRAMLRDRVRSLRDANVYEAQRYRHIIGPALIDGEDGGEVRAQTSFIVARIMQAGQTSIFASGRYHDRILLDAAEQDGAFVEKLVILDSRVIDTLLAIPL